MVFQKLDQILIETKSPEFNFMQKLLNTISQITSQNRITNIHIRKFYVELEITGFAFSKHSVL